MKTKQAGDKRIGTALRTFNRTRVAKTQTRDHSIRVRVTAQESHDIKGKAHRLNVSVSDLLRQLFQHANENL